MNDKSSNCLLCDISYAAKHGDIQEVQRILDSDVDLSIDEECNTALFDALEVSWWTI